MAAETKHIHLTVCPADVKELIEKEQARLKLFENKSLKQEFVIYEMLREWYKFKNKNAGFMDN